MDVDEFIKSRFPQYYKARNSNFGNVLKPEERTNRLKQQNLERTKKRLKTLQERRNIQETSMEEVKLKDEAKKPSRKSLLRVWQAQRKIKVQNEKSQKKPVFKVPSAPNIGFPEVSKIYSNNKSIAPKEYKFKPPKNIKPIELTNQKNEKVAAVQKVNVSYTKPVTRSQKPAASPPLPLPTRRTKKVTVLTENSVNRKNVAVPPANTLKKPLKTTRQPPVINNESAHNCNNPVVKIIPLSEEKLNDIHRRSLRRLEESENTAPDTKDEDRANVSPTATESKNRTPLSNRRSIVYVSPFVSTSRGKGSVKKENREREIRGT